MAKVVIALGGNALGNTPSEQIIKVEKTVAPIADLIEDGNQVIICHGNGPQVGMINLGMTAAYDYKKIQEAIPFPECGAMSQGYIGYHIQNCLGNELAKRGIKKNISTIITQVRVDENDQAFSNPTKPIGRFYSREEAERIIKERNCKMIDDAGRGYREVVPSPIPVEIIERDIINSLSDAGNVVIAAGGGGIPVIRKDGKLAGVPAVIDKDFASAKLAETINADMLVILTAVDNVAINWNKSNQQMLEKMTVSEAEEYIAQGQFAPGSMLPKVKAAVSFARRGGTAIIAALENAPKALIGESGTRITSENS